MDIVDRELEKAERGASPERFPDSFPADAPNKAEQTHSPKAGSAKVGKRDMANVLRLDGFFFIRFNRSGTNWHVKGEYPAGPGTPSDGARSYRNAQDAAWYYCREDQYFAEIEETVAELWWRQGVPTTIAGSGRICRRIRWTG